MSGQAIVSIGDSQWLVDVAGMPWELAQGLSGIPEISPGTGMLFDVGWEQAVTVTTEVMLFPMDIAFLDESLTAVHLVRGLTPGQQATSEALARYFLEVNAGELESVGVGDQVSVELLAPEGPPVQVPDWVGVVMPLMTVGIMGAFVFGVLRPVIKSMFANPGNPGKALNPGKSSRRYHSAFLVNWQYGGYSFVEEDPEKPERLWVRGMADYADPDQVITIAEREGLPHVSLAGGFWERIGRSGWGEQASIAEAREALAAAREHVLGGKHGPHPPPGSNLPTRSDVSVDSWMERDRLGIWIVDKRTDKVIAEWWDDEARQMFEDGFFKQAASTRGGELRGGEFVDSVLDYAEEMGWLAGENPGHLSNPTGAKTKVRARSITLQRAEGTIGRDDFSPDTVRAAGDRSVWQQADRQLLEWAQTAPQGGGYHKVDFIVAYEDGNIYRGRYDLKHWSVEYPSLAKHMRSLVAFHAGEYRPPHMTEQQYREALRTEPFASTKEESARFLAEYEIGDPAPLQIKDRGAG